MKENNQVVDRTMSREPEKAPAVIIRRGNTTYRIGLHFSRTGREEVEDKLRKLMLKELLE